MNPFLIALVAPLLWAVINHVDKYLLSKYFKSDGVGALILVSALFALLILPVVLFIEPTSLSVPLRDAAIMIGAGVMYGIGVLLYLYALDNDEATIVVPFFQLIPIFGYIFGVIFLSEVLNLSQICAGILMIIGSCVLSLEKNESGNYGFKWRLIALMMGSVIFYGIIEVLFKYVAVDIGYWEATFWHYAGLLLFGILLFFLWRPYRDQFIEMIRENSKQVMALNSGSEIFTMIGDRILAFATLLAPVALMQLATAYQPVFVLIIGVVLATYFPHISEEDLSFNSLFQKSIGIILIVFGSAMLYL